MPSLKKYRTAVLLIDEQSVTLQIARLSLEAAEAFKARLRVLLSTERENEALSPDEAAFVRAAFADYVSLATGALDVDGDPITTGEQLLGIVGEHGGLVMQTLLAIANKTTPTAAEGKASASGSDSGPSSDASIPAPDGDRPAPTVTDAAPVGSAPTVAATVETASASSGSTATSS